MLHTLLVPIDGSSHAQMALELGADIAAKYDARLILLHVVTRDGAVPDGIYLAGSAKNNGGDADNRDDTPGAKPMSRGEIQQQIGELLLQNASEYAAARGVATIEKIIDTGDADKRILYQAKNAPADLIVMGRRGLGKIKKLVMGSVSHNVFHLSPCSCVTVHSTEGKPGFEDLESILVPTDGSEQADKAVELASDIAAKYDAGLTLVYVMSRGPSLETLRSSIDMSQLTTTTQDEIAAEKHPVAEHMSSTFIPPVLSKTARTEIGNKVLARCQQIAGAKGVSSQKLVLLSGADPARKILQVAKRKKPDLIVMGGRGLGGAAGLLTGSTSYKVNHSAKCACLVVR